ncbi:hypothetical protein EGR_03242 [Echinococcus granulosus]|uniref:Coiled-coil domain-containing protein 186 n=1 Tax=Echinococcus granulosus TaxID=6210 RepID=U6J1C0_ECHGR|nr:hypothetical protein EGR_03242 [Echinococcus granulosus]EUB61969.1 hypothetical protein EGR_03242 [Echinococcus granulosus]CDS17778.1 hypothetical protein EgrG_001054600 [Echinococcus granulosus]
METEAAGCYAEAKLDNAGISSNLNQVYHSTHLSKPRLESGKPLLDSKNANTASTENPTHSLESEVAVPQNIDGAESKEVVQNPHNDCVDDAQMHPADIINPISDYAQVSSQSLEFKSLDANVKASELHKEFECVNNHQVGISTSERENESKVCDSPWQTSVYQGDQKVIHNSSEEQETNGSTSLDDQVCLNAPHPVNLQSLGCEGGTADSTQGPVSREESNCSSSSTTENKADIHSHSDNSTSILASSTDKVNEEDDSSSNFFSIGGMEDPNKVSVLQAKVEDLTKKLLRSQEQMESLLEEKQRWLTNRQQQSQPYAKHKTSVSSDTAAIVVKFAQSERQRMKAEAKVEELEATIARLRTENIPSSDSAIPTKQSGSIEEFSKALAEARERAEHLRHALRQEEARVGDLGAQLATTREAHRNEQKRAAGQAEVISKLNRDIDSLKRQLKDANKVREREAKRLCDEMALRETTEKYNKALSEVAALQERVTQLEEVQKSKLDLEGKYEALQKAHDSLLSVREEMASCVERETQLSEFTRRLTERNAGLQTAHLATQARLEASERAVGEASRAAKEATDLLHALEQRARTERTQAANTIASLEAKISGLRQSEEALKVELTREQVEKASLKRKQHALDRELARLMAQQRKLSHQVSTSGPPYQDATLDRSLTDSNLSLSAPNNTTSVTSDPLKPSPSPPVLGDALLVASKNGEMAATHVVSVAREVAEDNIRTPDLEVQTLEPNRVLLLNKIDRLQRTNVRLMEKIDFMHEHIDQLTQELQKKSQILQHCLTRESDNEGAAVPSAVDANKRQRMRRGGTLMAAIFAGEGDTTSSDLRTSLQLNQKLQSVLEDTLYKNLTLKENVDTLADEVATLKRANKELKSLVSTRSGQLTAGPHR